MTSDNMRNPKTYLLYKCEFSGLLLLAWIGWRMKMSDHSNKRHKHAPVYLDYLATTPICDQASEAMIKLLKHQHYPNGCWGNAGSTHHEFGRKAKAALEDARGKVARLLNCASEEIVFESGSTESINHAIKGILAAKPDGHVVISQIEHPAVMQTVQEATRGNFSMVKPNEVGIVEPDDVAKACIKGKTTLVSIMMVNNELGSVMDIASIVKKVKEVDANIVFHCDASQGVGKIPVDVKALQVDLLTVAGHKFYGPKGIGALYIRKGLSLQSLIHGAGHESSRRAGTENVLLAVGLGEACDVAHHSLVRDTEHSQGLREALYATIVMSLPKGAVIRNGPHLDHQRLPNALSISFTEGVRGNDVATKAGEQGVAFSAGAACHSGHIEPSRVLKAVGMDDTLALGTIRLSIGRDTKPEDIDRGAQVITEIVRQAREDIHKHQQLSQPM